MTRRAGVDRTDTGPKHAPRAPRVPFALLVTGLIVGGLALLLTLNTFSAANELNRNGLADKDAVVAAEVQDLRNQVAASAAPGNLAAAAVALGMVPAGHPAFLVVGADGVVRVMGNPKPVSAVAVSVPASHKAKKKHKKAKPKATAKPKPTSAHSTRTPARSTTAAAHSSTSPTSSKTAPKPSSKPKPTPTPTPVVTLPGGTR